MRNHWMQTLALWMAVAITAGGCSSTSTVVDGYWLEVGDDGELRQMSSVVLDFGAVEVQRLRERSASIVNAGRVPLTISRAATREGSDEGFDEAFSQDFEPITLGAGSKAELTFRFKPTTMGAHVATMTFLVRGAGSKELPITLKGVGLIGGCLVEPDDRLDFGLVMQADSLADYVRIRNRSERPYEVSVGGIIGSANPSAFSFADFPPGRHTVPARGELAVPIKFTPPNVGLYEATVSVAEPGMCVWKVKLSGVGTDQLFECAPRATVDGKSVCRVNFGPVLPKHKATANVVLRNIGREDLKLRLPKWAPVQPPGQGAPFALDTSDREFSVPASGGQIAVPVSFSPTEYGRQLGWLDFEVPGTAMGVRAELYGEGTGPKIQVTPEPLGFGTVSVDTWKWGKLAVINVGANVEGTTDDNLRLVKRNDDGTMVEPAIELLGDTNGEFALQLPQVYPAAGIPPVAGEDRFEVWVAFHPKTPGKKQAVLRIHSNDPAHPVVDAQIQGFGTSGSCEYYVRPNSLVFGLVEPPGFAQQSFFIVNASSSPDDICLIARLDLGPYGSAAWTLVNGPITDQLLPGGASLEVPVRFQPYFVGASYWGEIEFSITSATRPQSSVVLYGGATEKRCLTMAPSEVDFGPVGPGCSSGNREVRVRNVCTTPVTLERLSSQSGYSTAFRLIQTPTLPAILAPGSEKTFTVSYLPADVGLDVGLIAVKTSQHLVPYAVTLTGRGATQPTVTDVFVQDRAKVDILLVVDDGASTSGLQASLARNFASFLRFLNLEGIDYHLAVTTTGVDKAHGNAVTEGVNYNGLFAPLDRSRPTVLTPNTPNVEWVFSQNVAVGTGGNNQPMLLRPFMLALSEPQLSSPNNAGFLRDEAGLAIVVVSNADDQDSAQTSLYQQFLLSLKGHRLANMVSFSGIVPTRDDPPAGCSYRTPGAPRSRRVESLAAATGGVVGEICDADWAVALADLGRRTFTRTRFLLSSEPEAASRVVVKIDGLDYPSQDNGEVRWTYNSAVYAIDFERRFAPSPGARVEIAFEKKCRP